MSKNTISFTGAFVDIHILQLTLQCICADARQKTLGAAGQGRKG